MSLVNFGSAFAVTRLLSEGPAHSNFTGLSAGSGQNPQGKPRSTSSRELLPPPLQTQPLLQSPRKSSSVWASQSFACKCHHGVLLGV